MPAVSSFGADLRAEGGGQVGDHPDELPFRIVPFDLLHKTAVGLDDVKRNFPHDADGEKPLS